MTTNSKNHCSTCTCGTPGLRTEILVNLNKRLLVHRGGGPPATGGMPSPTHIAHWAKDDMLVSVIEELEKMEDR